MPDTPAWLQKFLGLDAEKLKTLGVEAADIEAAKTGYAKTAEMASSVEKIRERYPDLNIDEAIGVAQKWTDWGKTSWPEFERNYNAALAENAELRKRPAAPVAAAAAGNTRHYDITQDDLWETAKLHAALEKIDDQIGERVFTRVTKDWWEKEVAPTWQKTADNYMDINLQLFKALWGKVFGTDAPDLNAVLREATTRGNRDFATVVTDLTKASAATKKGDYESGYAKANEENAAKLKALEPAVVAASPTGPSGTSMPPWKSAAGATPPVDGLALKARVLGDVAKKHGPLPA